MIKSICKKDMFFKGEMMEKIYGYVVLTVLLLGIATALETKATDGKVKIFPIEACYAMDVYNPVEVVKEADYVFAGHVESLDGTIYKRKIWSRQENGKLVYSGDAYTEYTVTVQSNLKKKLPVGETIVLSKMGGIREDGSGYDLFEDDFLPEVGKNYIFIANEQADGSLIVSGANSNIEINESNLKSVAAIKSAKEYKIYEKAVKQQTADTESLKNDMQNK